MSNLQVGDNLSVLFENGKTRTLQYVDTRWKKGLYCSYYEEGQKRFTPLFWDGKNWLNEGLIVKVQKLKLQEEPDYTITGSYITDLQILQEASPDDFENLKISDRQFYYLSTNIKFANQLYRGRCILHYNDVISDKLVMFDDFFNKKKYDEPYDILSSIDKDKEWEVMQIYQKLSEEDQNKFKLYSWKDIYYFCKNTKNKYTKADKQSTINLFIYADFFTGKEIPEFISMSATDVMYLYAKFSKNVVIKFLHQIIEVEEFKKIETFIFKYILNSPLKKNEYFNSIQYSVMNAEIILFLIKSHTIHAKKRDDYRIVQSCLDFIRLSNLPDKKKIYLLNTYLLIYPFETDEHHIGYYNSGTNMTIPIIDWILTHNFIFSYKFLENLFIDNQYDSVYYLINPPFNIKPRKNFIKYLKTQAKISDKNAIDLLEYIGE